MLLLITLLGGIGVIISFVRSSLQHWFCGLVIIMIMSTILAWGYMSLEPPANLTASAYRSEHTGVFAIYIYFDEFSQDGDIVTVDHYYTNAMHWTDFKAYDEHTTPIEIQIPEGQVFQYTSNPARQTVIE